jgi:rod shape-determining protein MreC
VRGPSLGARLLLLAAASLALMVLDHRNGHLEALRSGLSVLVYPVRALVDLPFSATRWVEGNVRDRSALLEENASLREQQLDTRARLQRLAALEAENARLRALLDSSAKVADRVLVSEIMSVDLDRFHHRILIDKGTHQGAYRGQALLSADGIVGQITRAEPFTSEAILISDPSHALPVEINRNGLRAIAVGSGDLTRLSLPFLPNNADVEVGDLLVSSGLGGSFPAGYPVGVITAVERDPGEPFATVAAEPAAALNRTHEVLLVWSSKPPAEAAPDAAPAAAPLASPAAPSPTQQAQAGQRLAEGPQ